MTAPLQLGSILEAMADQIGDLPALITNDVTLTYNDLDERSTRLANHLISCGISAGDHVAVHGSNSHQWVESFYACFKMRAVPVNVNYRYVHRELVHVYGNADCAAVIAEQRHSDAIGQVREEIGGPDHVLFFGASYEAAIKAASPSRDFEHRSGEDLYIIYTGGTTGLPKGVMWRQQDLVIAALNEGRQGRPIESVSALASEAAASQTQGRILAPGPMMHGGTQWACGNALVMGGVFILYTLEHFDASEVLALAARTGAHSLTTMGDAMARPIAEARLAPGGDDHDLSQLVVLSNGAAPLSQGVREQLSEAFPNQLIMDGYGASETGSTGRGIYDGSVRGSPRFEVGPETAVLNGSTGAVCAVGEVGKLARSGHIPIGYYNDTNKTSETFVVRDGVRWVIPGDAARLEADGTISLLGRGSTSINSGAEKIYPEEVESVLKQHGCVFDAAVVGTPSDRWGEQVTALVQLRPGAQTSVDELGDHCRDHLADYKVPKQMFFVEQVPRTEVGKVDYGAAKTQAMALLAQS